jgi:hypothetical protein
MVTTAVMSQFHSGKGGGNASNRDLGSIWSSTIKQLPNHDRPADNVSSPTPSVALGLPVAATEEDQARSPIGVSHTAHHFYYLPPAQEKAGLTEDTSHDEGSRGESSFGDPNVHTDLFHPLQDQSQYPPSPMVTPPARSTHAARTPFIYSSVMTVPRHGPKKASRNVTKDTRSLFSHPVEGVPRVYHDYSEIPSDDETYVRKKTGGVTQPFPEKLHEMLSAVEGTGNESIVSWLPHGRAFIVRKPKEFTDVIMPK